MAIGLRAERPSLRIIPLANKHSHKRISLPKLPLNFLKLINSQQLQIKHAKIAIKKDHPKDIQFLNPLQIFEEGHQLIATSLERGRDRGQRDGAIGEGKAQVIAEEELVCPGAVGLGD